MQPSHEFDFAKYSQSRMSPFDEYALHILLKKFNSSDLMILEIGSWLGAGSTQIFSRYAHKIVCVDHWLGNANQEHQDIIKQVDPYNVFRENTKPFEDKIVAMRCDSSVIGDLLKDQIFDFIFIDGDHRYDQTRKDILGSFLKLKKSGIIAGHDCEGRLNEKNRQYIASNVNEDHVDSIFPNFKHMHPGVICAVDEIFPDFELFGDEQNKLNLPSGQVGYSSIWCKRVDIP